MLGRSPNGLLALDVGRKKEMVTTIGMRGRLGVQQGHMAIEYAICQIIEEQIFPKAT